MEADPERRPGRPRKQNQVQHLRPVSSSWETDVGGYSEFVFYIAASDERGHSDTIGVKVPPEVLGRISAIIQSGKIRAYKTPADFFRDAMFHRLHWIAAHMDDANVQKAITEDIAAVELRDQVAREKRTLRAFQDFTMDFDSVLTGYRAHPDLLRKKLERFRESAVAMPEPYRTEALARIDANLTDPDHDV